MVVPSEQEVRKIKGAYTAAQLHLFAANSTDDAIGAMVENVALAERACALVADRLNDNPDRANQVAKIVGQLNAIRRELLDMGSGGAERKHD